MVEKIIEQGAGNMENPTNEPQEPSFDLADRKSVV